MKKSLINKMSFSCIIILLIMMMTFSVFRAEEPVHKEVAFELSQNYDACSFSITVEKNGNFKVELFSEDGEVYIGTIENGNSCNINVQGVKKGRWNVKVTEILEEFEYEEDTENEVIERNADEIIGKIQITAKTIDASAISVGNVSVARDIVGLRTYFKDDAIVVDWTDTSCGNVNVAVLDTSTSQILDKQTIKGQYYEFELPELVDEISVSIVPSTSANIEGAESQFTLKVGNNPDADILYEDKEYTNMDTIPIKAVLNNSYSLLFVNNGEELISTELLSAGTYSYDIPVSEGVNNILTYVIDEKHNMRSTAYTVVRDSVKPALTLDMEYDGAATYDDIAVITGTIRDYDTFTINEVVPTIAGDGSFKAEYVLKDGENILNIKATDIAGNETVYTATVTKLIKTSPDITSYIPQIICIVVVIIAGVVVILRKKLKVTSESGSVVGEKNSSSEDNPRYERININLSDLQKKIIISVVTLVVSYLFFTRVLIFGNIPSSSMEPVLKTGDWVIINGLAYVNKEPQRGDVIIFDNANVTQIKRVIGIPGDSLMFIDGYLYINGQLCYEEYLSEDTETNCGKAFENIPVDCYFVMGDNRENSNDSRFWDDPYVRMEDIKGKLITDIPIAGITNTIKSLMKNQ